MTIGSGEFVDKERMASDNYFQPKIAFLLS